MEEIGSFFETNSKKISEISSVEWKIALIKCEEHLDYRLKMKTLYGAHTAKNLGVDAKNYYMNFATDALLFGHWEWKDEFDLPQQLIRIIDSRISTVVKSYKLQKEKNNKKIEDGFFPETVEIDYRDVELDFYKLSSDINFDYEKAELFEEKIKEIEKEINSSNDENVGFLWECIKEGKKRNQISELMNMTPKQVDKIKEKLVSITKKIINHEI
ncbi:hypothetical protein [Flavobacterium sangjuense]|uniref:Uncharacterized protein n=1 Tax=Flavobacterium sangjuense TaxID=2518177 RepID=A0A4P7PR40_9FLAO|nr:hypothetical protein [Flavobacterium sangjuense]QBZ97341.1 hypothetical protein GS03_00829 [Flavobacterium sangjuense]